MAGMADCILAGGTESMSMLRGNTKFRPNPYLVENYPEVYLSMGLTAENVARKYGVSREESRRLFVSQSSEKRWLPRRRADSKTTASCHWR